jgi:hypothetical protein
MDVETKRIPRRLKDTGFRWGITFDNPKGKEIGWYEIIHLPARLNQLSGDSSEVGPTVARG